MNRAGAVTRLLAGLRGRRVAPEDAGDLEALIAALESGEPVVDGFGLTCWDGRPGDLWLQWRWHQRDRREHQRVEAEAAALASAGICIASDGALRAIERSPRTPEIREAASWELVRRRRAWEDEQAKIRQYEVRPQDVGHGDGGRSGGW